MCDYFIQCVPLNYGTPCRVGATTETTFSIALALPPHMDRKIYEGCQPSGSADPVSKRGDREWPYFANGSLIGRIFERAHALFLSCSVTKVAPIRTVKHKDLRN